MPGKKSIGLTRLESTVMRAVWAAEPAPVCVRDVLERVNRRRTQPLAYNTVQTVLTILKEKKVVVQVPGGGRAHRYRARVSRREASRRMISDVVERMFSGQVQPLLLQLVEDTQLKPDELRQLRAWIDERLKDSSD